MALGSKAKSIGGGIMIAVGGFFILGTTMLTIANINADMEPGYAVAGAISTVSGQTMLLIGIGLVVGGIMIRRKKKAPLDKQEV